MSEAGCLRLTSGYIGNASRGESLPGYGFVGFSNMGVSALTAFTLMSSSNFANLLRYVGDSNDTVTAWLYIVSLVLVSRFILVGLPIAIVSNSWIGVARERSLRQEKREQDVEDDAVLERLKLERKSIDENPDLQVRVGGGKTRARIIRQAILRRLGAKDASQLRTEIVSVFNLFDADGSGEIGLAELLAAFRRLGVELTLREAEKLIADADEDGNGIVDVDEFVEMVESMLGIQHGYVDLHHIEDKEEEGMASADGTRSARTPTAKSQSIKAQAGGRTQNKPMPSNQAANDEDDDYKEFQGIPTEPVCCGLFRVDRRHFEPNLEPLSFHRWLVARLMNAPCRIDECGNQIPSTLTTIARLRNVELKFGPSARAWQAWSTGKGAIMNSAVPDTQQEMDPAPRRKNASTLHFPMGAKLPDGNGLSGSLERHDIKEYLGTNFQNQSSIVALHSKYTRALTCCFTPGTPIPPFRHGPHHLFLFLFFLYQSNLILCHRRLRELGQLTGCKGR
jgi:hypothetical protein